jgi:hypothetical protein
MRQGAGLSAPGFNQAAGLGSFVYSFRFDHVPEGGGWYLSAFKAKPGADVIVFGVVHCWPLLFCFSSARIIFLSAGIVRPVMPDNSRSVKFRWLS